MRQIPDEARVYVDETGAHPHMARLYGRSLLGQPVIEAKRHRPRAGEKLTWMGGLSCQGLLAPCELRGNLTGELFLAYVKQVLLPEMKPGQVLILDNLSCHKVHGVEEACQEAGIRLLYLPPYSPELSPIEECWSKVKAILRKLAVRCVEKLTSAVLQACDAVTVTDIQGWFRHANSFIH